MKRGPAALMLAPVDVGTRRSKGGHREGRNVVKALVVAEEDRIASRVNMTLRLRWPDADVATASSAHRARLLLADADPDVLFVSSGLPGPDSLTLVRDVRAISDVLIFVVGPGDSETEWVDALESGADDFVSTSSSESLLVAKVWAALRRAEKVGAESAAPVKCGGLLVDPQCYEASLNGKPLYLTPTEFKLLYHLAQNRGLVVTQQALESLIWGCPERLYIDVLRKHVQRLRQKLENGRGGRMTITTVPRVGYKLEQKRRVRSGR